MSTTSPLQAIPLPDSASAANVPYDLGLAVGALEKQIVQSYASAAARTAALPSPTDGMVTYLQDVDTFEVRMAGAWVQFVLASGSQSVGTVPTGTLLDFAGSSAPSGYLLCAGQAVSRTTYANLFAVIGTTYGAGDGSTTFTLPDFRGRVAAGKDNLGGTAANRITGGTTLGGSGGAEAHTHTSAAHTHTSAAHTHGVSATHTHTSPSHSHTLGAGYAQMIIGTTSNIFSMRGFTTNFTSDRGNTFAGNGAAESVGRTTATALGGSTDATTPGSTGASAPGSTDSATPADTGSTTPGATGSTSNLAPYLLVTKIIRT